MRKISDVRGNPQIKRVMLNKKENGVYLFLYDREIDSACKSDLWFETIEDLYEHCLTNFGIQETDWMDIPEAYLGCQDDWIEPVRVKGRDQGKPVYGKFERLENGSWIGIE